MINSTFCVVPGMSHTDHVTPAVIDHVKEVFKHKTGFFIETITLPDYFPEMPDALYGPINGDQPVSESEVYYAKRPGREYDSRLINKPARMTRKLTVIAGPHKEYACLLYTVFGGPCSEKEVLDPTLNDAQREKAEKFWAEHALAQSK